MTTTTLQTVAPDHDADTRRVVSPRLADLEDDLRNLGELLATLDPGDARWEAVGPMTATVAARVREAAGRPQVAVDLVAAPVVHQRDLAVAARSLMGSRAAVVDASAAIEAQALCLRISMALA